ncbi:MAG: dihydroorotase [Candidatus Omnitrophica bacterium]|nr:dihydroorotase [Candidatus Omnitrophota bacterium]
MDGVMDILIEEGKIVNVAKGIKKEDSQVLDASGKAVIPGLIDMHTHLREPGREDEETIRTGSRAAAKGGFSSICCMANTTPCVDNQGVVEFIYSESKKVGLVNVYPIGAVTKGLAGKELAEIGELKRSGIIAISDDGNPILNSEIMRRAFEYSKMFGIPVLSHCEDKSLSSDGVMNEGYVSILLGLRGMPPVAESVMVARDVQLSEAAGASLHIAHVTCAHSINIIREAKKRGVKVSCEVTPHHFTLTEEAVQGFNTNAKMNPPLRAKDDIDTIKEGLRDGTIDVIASDHAPHTENEKDVEFDSAPFGVIGLETSLSLTIMELLNKGILTFSQLVEKMSANPARILGLKKGSLGVGMDADITVVDIEHKWVVDKSKLESKSKNSPFIGWELKGMATEVIVGGKIIIKDGKII